MKLTRSEWLEIKDWLSDLLVYYEDRAEINKGYRGEEYYRRECDRIRKFLKDKSD